MTHLAAARAYLAVQAVAGAFWWLLVLISDVVRLWTLGGWDPRWLVGPDLLLFVGGSAVAAIRSSWKVGAVTAVWTALLAVTITVYGLAERAAGWGVLLMVAAALGSVAAALTLRSGRMPTRWFFVGPFRFRVAPSRPRWRQVATSLLQLVVFWVSFFVLLPLLLRAVESRLQLRWEVLDSSPWPLVGLVLFIPASVLGLSSCLTMSGQGDGTPLPAQTARKLVVAGPYRWLRNPMATAGVLQSIGIGLGLGTWTMIVVALAGAVAWHVGIRPVEEADLAARFGEPYERYRSRVRCWLPTFARQGG